MPPLPDRIDFRTISDGRVIVQKMRRDTTDPTQPRDIPLPDGHSIKPPGFDLESAIAWCQGHDYTVRRWHNGARAWLGGAWVIRTRYQIRKMRERAERNQENYCLDFAYDG